ncbi:MAG: TIGR00730 family Rossman fold protein [Bacteroidaceae bacterium]|nr:TIGR00730 family Rossman fold protein [Bacteroidaceae bacterium]
MSKNLCVFCASSAHIADKYKKAAYELGRLCAKHGWILVNGAGFEGLMGATSDGCQAAGGRVVGIIPRFMVDNGWMRQGLDEEVIAKDMAERKQLLRDRADAVLVLPGGLGTMEEMFETITQKQLGIFRKPIFIFNQDGYYNRLVAWLDHCAEEHFLRYEGDDALWTVVSSVEEVFEKLGV